VAWADAVREAGRLGASERTAQALAAGAGTVVARGTRVVVAAHAEVLLARWLPPGAATDSVRVGPLPHLREAPPSSPTPQRTSFLAGGSPSAPVPECRAILILNGRPRSATASGRSG
jgi:hypothetical protein